MKIELNKEYITEDGNVCKCIYVGPMKKYECACLFDNDVIETYMLDGTYDKWNPDSKKNIVKEYIRPQEVTIFVAMYSNGGISWDYTTTHFANAVCIKRLVLKYNEFDCKPPVKKDN